MPRQYKLHNGAYHVAITATRSRPAICRTNFIPHVTYPPSQYDADDVAAPRATLKLFVNRSRAHDLVAGRLYVRRGGPRFACGPPRDTLWLRRCIHTMPDLFTVGPPAVVSGSTSGDHRAVRYTA